MSSTTSVVPNVVGAGAKRKAVDSPTVSGGLSNSINNSGANSATDDVVVLDGSIGNAEKIIAQLQKKNKVQATELVKQTKRVTDMESVLQNVVMRMGKVDAWGQTDPVTGKPKKGMLGLAYSAYCFIKETQPDEFQSHMDNYQKKAEYNRLAKQGHQQQQVEEDQE
jgi:hypothetical protein